VTDKGKQQAYPSPASIAAAENGFTPSGSHPILEHTENIAPAKSAVFGRKLIAAPRIAAG
jgi:hypothetical protein